MRITRTKAGLAGICALAAGSFGLLGSQVLQASAADRQYNHYIQMGVDPIYQYEWSAEATLYDRNHNQVYHWHESHDHGDHVWWNYFANPGDTLDISFTPIVHGNSSNIVGLNADENHCYLVDGGGAHDSSC
jgi:hypothetical protein